MGWDVSKSTKVLPQIILLTIVVFSLTFSVAFADHLTQGFVELRGDGTQNCLQIGLRLLGPTAIFSTDPE